MPTNFQKAERRYKLPNGEWSDPISYATSSESVEMADGSNLENKLATKADILDVNDKITDIYNMLGETNTTNLINFDFDDCVVNGVIFSKETDVDGNLLGIVASGIAEENINLKIGTIHLIQNEYYKVLGSYNSSATWSTYLVYVDVGYDYIGEPDGIIQYINPDNDFDVYIRIKEGVEVNFSTSEDMFKPVVTYGSNTDDKFHVSNLTNKQLTKKIKSVENPVFAESNTRTNIVSGESLSILFGKIKKFFSDLKTVAFTGSYNDLIDQPSLGTASTKDYTTSVTQGSNDLVTSGAVYNAIDNLPEPMVFKGTLGINGTIASLPTASADNKGYTYKVITDGTYASQEAKVGDIFTSNVSEWVRIPSGDEDNDTWRAIYVDDTQALGSEISSGAVNIKSGDNVTITVDGNNVIISSFAGTEVYVDNETILKDDNDIISVNEFVGTMQEFNEAALAGEIEDGANIYITDDGTDVSETITEYILRASNWVNNTYVFSNYSSANYDIEIYTSPSMTLEQYNSFIDAKMIGDNSSNTIIALNGSPDIDIPILIKVSRSGSVNITPAPRSYIRLDASINESFGGVSENE